MESWKVLMANGNQSFKIQEWNDAEHNYYQAACLIEDQWLVDVENIELLLGWIASLHNLSILFEAQGQDEAALRYLTLPHERLVSLIEQEDLSEHFEAMLYSAIKVTFEPLLAFSQRYPICDACCDAWLAPDDCVVAPQQNTIH